MQRRAVELRVLAALASDGYRVSQAAGCDCVPSAWTRRFGAPISEATETRLPRTKAILQIGEQLGEFVRSAL